MTQPTIDPEAMLALAARMASASPEAARELQFFLDGKTTWRHALPAFNGCLRELLGITNKWPERKISKRLLSEIQAWAAIHGHGRNTGSGTVAQVSVKWPGGDLADVDRAAEMAGLSRAQYILQVTMAAVERDLAEARKTKAA